MSIIYVTDFMQKQNPRTLLRGFSIWDFVGLLPVNPLAYVVTYYICHNRNYEYNYVCHRPHLLPIGRSRQIYHTMLCTVLSNKANNSIPYISNIIIIVYPVKISKTEPENLSNYTKYQKT